MASITNGIVVSFGNTPQANGDSFAATEDSGVVYLNVMANDLGGNAKTLYSLDDGSSSSDLLIQDTARIESTSRSRRDS